MNKKYLLYAIVPAIIVASAGAAVANADSTSKKINPMSALITKIAEKFNLSQGDVQAVFDEFNQENQIAREEKSKTMQAEMDQKVKDELAQAVTDGKLTQSQVDLILAKKAELQAEKPTMENPTSETSATVKTEEEMKAEREQMKTKMEAKQKELKQWATDNGISDEYLRYVNGFGGENKMGGPNNNGGNFPQGPMGETPTNPISASSTTAE